MEFDLNLPVEVEENNDSAGINDLDADVGMNNEENSEPTIGMLFPTATDYALFCHSYAHRNGFSYHVRHSEVVKELAGKVGRKVTGLETNYEDLIRIRFECVSSSKRKRGDLGTTSTQRRKCGAFVDAKMRDGFMRIGTLKLHHTHPLNPANSRFMSNYRYLPLYHKRKILTNDDAGVPIKKSFNSMVEESGGHANLPFNEYDMRNLIGNHRRAKGYHGDAATMEAEFSKMKEDNPDFFSKIQTDDEGRLLNVFWSDARCRAAAKDFGDVITFDTTYMTNCYKMPFAPFIGVNHHGSTIILAAGLVAGDTAENFIWLFNCWKECMGRTPDGILTDQCKAIAKAIEKFFPQSRHRLCLFHIMVNAARNLGKLASWTDIDKSLKTAVHDSLSSDEFESAWAAMVKEFKLEENSWIKEAFNERMSWVPAYQKDTFWAEMTSTQRSEGVNHFFKGYLNQRTSLTFFLEQYKKALAAKAEDETKLNAKTASKPLQCDMRFLVESMFFNAYTNNKFKEVKEEVNGLALTNAIIRPREDTDGDEDIDTYDVSERIAIPAWKLGHKCKKFLTVVNRKLLELKCSCKLFEFRGILCRHILKVIELSEDIKEIPEKYVLNRWRKNIVREYERVKVSYYDPNKHQRVKRFTELSVRNEYMISLALHNDQEYVEELPKLERKMELALGIRHSDEQKVMEKNGKVFGRKRVQRKTDKEKKGPIERSSQDPVTKDPKVSKPKGRPPMHRRSHPAEAAARKKKQKKPPTQEDSQTSSHNQGGDTVNLMLSGRRSPHIDVGQGSDSQFSSHNQGGDTVNLMLSGRTNPHIGVGQRCDSQFSSHNQGGDTVNLMLSGRSSPHIDVGQRYDSIFSSQRQWDDSLDHNFGGGNTPSQSVGQPLFDLNEKETAPMSATDSVVCRVTIAGVHERNSRQGAGAGIMWLTGDPRPLYSYSFCCDISDTNVLEIQAATYAIRNRDEQGFTKFRIETSSTTACELMNASISNSQTPRFDTLANFRDHVKEAGCEVEIVCVHFLNNIAANRLAWAASKAGNDYKGQVGVPPQREPYV